MWRFAVVCMIPLVFGVAEARPTDKTGSPAENNAPAADPAAGMPAASPAETKAAKTTDLDTYKRAMSLLASKSATDLATACALFAEVTTSEDRDLADAARRRFEKALAKLSELDAPRAVTVVVDAWRRFGKQGDFTSALERVYAQLSTEAKGTPSVALAAVATIGRAPSGSGCDTVGRRLRDLVTISGELGKVKDNSEWRMLLASHAATCNPTPESLVVAYDLYTELGKAAEAATTATRIGDEYLTRFTVSWNVQDFNRATAYWEKAGIGPTQKRDALKPVADAAELAQRYAAAVAVLEWLRDPAAAELRPMLEAKE